MGNDFVNQLVDCEQEKKDESDKALDYAEIVKSKLAHL
jgi:hypothetical protein